MGAESKERGEWQKELGLVRRRTDRTKTILYVLMFLGFLLRGCVLLAVGAGAAAGVVAVAYIKGALETTYAVPLDQTWEATLDALNDL